MAASAVLHKNHASNPFTLETTSLNSLTSTGTVTGSAVDNSSDKYLYGDFELVITYGTNPTAGSAIELQLLRSLDGTNYEDATPGAAIVGAFILAATTSAQRLVIRGVPLPPGLFKPYIAAKTTGQTAASSGNTLKLNKYTPESQ